MANPQLIAQAITNPAIIGKWETLPYNCPINAIHGAILNTGKVVFIAGSGNNPDDFYTPNGTAILDLATGTFSRPKTPLDGNGKPYDLFCGGNSFLADGKLLLAGGTLKYDPFLGLPASFTLNPRTEQWTTVQPMRHGRWYPTQVTLSNGRVLAVSGTDENGKLNVVPEIYTPSGGWSFFSQPTSKLPMYAHLFLLESGKIFYSGAQFRASNKVSPRLLTLPANTTQPIIEQSVNGLQDLDYGDQSASVLLPPAQDQRVMIIGGGSGRPRNLNGSLNDNFGKGTDRVNIINLKSANPIYQPAAPLNFARMHVSAILLPDRTVFVCNGSGQGQNLELSMLPAEIYNPSTNTWTVVAKPGVSGRVYHSGALLLPDGRVITFGGNPDRGVYEPRLEVYSPPYLFKGMRPVIATAPTNITYGSSIQIQTPQAQNIQWVSLIRPSATTHSCDTEQRVVDLAITSATNNLLNVKVTNVANLAPRGWYMLFITDRNGVPSVAKWVRLLPNP